MLFSLAFEANYVASQKLGFFQISVQKSRAFSTPLFHHTPVNDQSTNHCLEEVLCGLFQKLLTGRQQRRWRYQRSLSNPGEHRKLVKDGPFRP